MDVVPLEGSFPAQTTRGLGFETVSQREQCWSKAHGQVLRGHLHKQIRTPH